MARFAYFADQPDGTVIEWRDTVEHGQVRAARGISNNGNGDVRGYVDGLGWIKISRSVEMKANPSRHICDSRCLNATGLIMKCECSCGGKNHGRGQFAAVAA